MINVGTEIGRETANGAIIVGIVVVLSQSHSHWTCSDDLKSDQTTRPMWPLETL